METFWKQLLASLTRGQSQRGRGRGRGSRVTQHRDSGKGLDLEGNSDGTTAVCTVFLKHKALSALVVQRGGDLQTFHHNLRLKKYTLKVPVFADLHLSRTNSRPRSTARQVSTNHLTTQQENPRFHNPI